MTPAFQFHDRTFQGAIPSGLGKLPIRPGWLTRGRSDASPDASSPARGNRRDRRRLMLLLVAIMLPALLLGLGLVNRMSEPSAPAGNLAREAEEAHRVLALLLHQHGQSIGSVAVGPAAEVASDLDLALERIHSAFPAFETLAFLDTSGEPVAQAGQASPWVWGSIPAVRAALQGQGTVSPVTADLGGNADIGYLVFAAPFQGRPGQADLVVAGVIKSEVLLASVQQALHGAQVPAGAPGDFARQVQRQMRPPAADATLRLVSQPGSFAGQNEDAASVQVYQKVSPAGATPPWYLLVEGKAPSGGSPPLTSDLSLGMALAAVVLAVTAGQIMVRPPRPVPAPGQQWPESAYPGPAQEPAAPFTASPQEVYQRLVAVQESVRQEMADYLHGHVQSKLVALSMALGMCQQMLDRDPATACQMLERIQDELRRVQDEDVRRVSRELFPSIIKMGLAPAMRSLTSRFSSLVEVELDIDPKLVELDQPGACIYLEKRRLGVYRVAEEALTNALKHAGARRLQVSRACLEGNLLVLSVVDNGCGFDPDRFADSHGLIGMRDYAEAIGARTDITSAPGRGTAVRLTLPLPAEEPSVTRPMARSAAGVLSPPVSTV